MFPVSQVKHDKFAPISLPVVFQQQPDTLVFVAAHFTGTRAKEWLNVKGYVHISMGKKGKI